MDRLIAGAETSANSASVTAGRLWWDNRIMTPARATPISVLAVSPAGYSSRFVDALTNQGLRPLAVPLIETVIPDHLPQLDHLVTRLASYAYVVFSSRQAIESLARKVRADDPRLRQVSWCAIGSDAEYLRQRLGLDPAFQPDEPSPRGIARKLATIEGIAGKTIAALVPRVEGLTEPAVVPDFLASLTQIGLDVTRVDAYVTRPVPPARARPAVDLIASRAVDVVAFTSAAEIDALLLTTGGPDALAALTVTCLGPYTAAHASQRGLVADIVARDFSSFAGFAEAIAEATDRP